MQGHVLTHACLNEMVNHEGGDASTAPLWMREEEGDVSFVALHVRNHKREADDALPVQHDATEVWILKTLGH